ncbi:hypothetical protein Q5P01_021817 [Channa striata]|uniref:Uncharacterized protein n=1 Tax=Channa striata TaxID=64152 RepID=A0AA88LUU0_CHASR|nr:hypothetical protein Q5P01_021817 [Channa striata]
MKQPQVSNRRSRRGPRCESRCHVVHLRRTETARQLHRPGPAYMAPDAAGWEAPGARIGDVRAGAGAPRPHGGWEEAERRRGASRPQGGFLLLAQNPAGLDSELGVRWKVKGPSGSVTEQGQAEVPLPACGHLLGCDGGRKEGRAFILLSSSFRDTLHIDPLHSGMTTCKCIKYEHILGGLIRTAVNLISWT